MTRQITRKVVSEPKPPSPQPPELVFRVSAWLKLQFLCHTGNTEIGAFGIARSDNPLHIADVRTVRQRASPFTVEFDDEAVADFFDEMVDAGLSPEQFARIWIHTHPGRSPAPSLVDEETFDRVFGRCDWAVMFILARGGETYCRLRARTPGRIPLLLERQVPVRVDFAELGRGSGSIDLEQWVTEYAANVQASEELWDRWGSDREGPRAAETTGSLLDWFDSLTHEEQELFLEDAHREDLMAERAFDAAFSEEEESHAD